jgi:amino acid transporter
MFLLKFSRGEKDMKSKNLIILSVWSAVTIIFVVLSVIGVIYTTTVQPTQWLIWMFDDWWVVFLITLIFTGVVSFFIKEPETNLQSNLQNIDSKLDLLFKEVAAIKKAIED